VRILLDTCAFLGLIQGSPELSETSRDLISDPQSEVYLSSVSAWEISVKHQLGRLALSQSPLELVPRQRKAHGIESLFLSEDAALQISRLPPLHRDPFDRMLICQAISESLTILTPDSLIQQYPVRSIW